MYCPTCTITPLVLAQRQGVEIDFCPHCRGVWLDRGELDKLLARAAGSQPKELLDGDSGREGLINGRPRSRRHRHRNSWLSEIFD